MITVIDFSVDKSKVVPGEFLSEEDKKNLQELIDHSDKLRIAGSQFIHGHKERSLVLDATYFYDREKDVFEIESFGGKGVRGNLLYSGMTKGAK